MNETKQSSTIKGIASSETEMTGKKQTENEYNDNDFTLIFEQEEEQKEEAKTTEIQDDKNKFFVEYDPSKICKICISGSNLCFFTIKKSGKIICDESNTENGSEWFLSIPISKNKIQLKSIEYDKYLQLDVDNTLIIRDYPKEFVWTVYPLIFDVIINKDNKDNNYSFNFNEKYLSLIRNNNVIKLCDINNKELSDNEKFKIVVNNKQIYNPSKLCKIGFSSPINNKYITTLPRWAEFKLVTEFENLFEGEVFTSIPIKESKSNIIKLKADKRNKYLKMRDDDIVYASSNYQHFEIIPLRNNKFAVKSCVNGKYLSVKPKISRNEDKLIKLDVGDEKLVWIPLECHSNEITKNEIWNIEIANGLKWFFLIYVRSFGDVDSIKQTFTIRAEISIHRELSSSELSSYIDSPNKFEPEFEINCVPLGVEEMFQEPNNMTFGNRNKFVVEWQNDLNCYVLRRNIEFSAAFIESLDFKNFPFNVSPLQFTIAFRTDYIILNEYNIQENLIWIEEMSLYQIPIIKLAEWKTHSTQLHYVEVEQYEPGKCVFNFIIIVERCWWYYIRTIILMLGLISSLTLIAFVFEDNDSRLGFLSSQFLTAVAYMFIVTSYLPRINDTTLLDQYVYFVVFFIFIIGIQMAVNLLFIDDETFDIYFLMFDSISWIVWNIYFIIICIVKYREEREKITYRDEVFDVNDKKEEFVIKTNTNKQILVDRDDFKISPYWQSELARFIKY